MKKYTILILLAIVFTRPFVEPIFCYAKPWKTLIPIIANLATIAAFAVACYSLHRSCLAAEAQLMSNYNDKYFQEDMGKAIVRLNKFKQSNDAYFYLHRKPYNNEPEGACFVSFRRLYIPDDVHAARRLVKGYFLNALDLYEHGMLTDKVFMEILDKGGIVTLFHVIEPLEWQHNRDYDASKFYRLMKYASSIYEKHLHLVQHFEKH